MMWRADAQLEPGPVFDVDWGSINDLCLGHARRVLGAGADAAQNAMIRLWRRRSTLERTRHPRAWAATVARNEALRLATQRARLPAAQDPATEVPDTSTDMIGEPDRSPDLLGVLGSRERQLLTLRYQEDLSYGQIAERLQLPVGTVKVRLHRAHNRLRRSMTDGRYR